MTEAQFNTMLALMEEARAKLCDVGFYTSSWNIEDACSTLEIYKEEILSTKEE